ncbi:hypothetical protein EYF80_033196 [Liparis tanakae]|uniref:Uncharacterized protein n=1 Tax=Liparis tanakae TaxID=230148 RepID=A0A4Z2GTB4_9TELE|nr:hypothetical protein EYF80_033196 [Liparis tanakae]
MSDLEAIWHVPPTPHPGPPGPPGDDETHEEEAEMVRGEAPLDDATQRALAQQHANCQCGQHVMRLLHKRREGLLVLVFRSSYWFLFTSWGSGSLATSFVR